jgi:hypothetical protein
MEHPVARKLRTVVKYLETGTRLTSLAPCRIHRVYSYSNDLLAGLAAMGLFPMIAIFSSALGGNPANPANEAPAGDLWTTLQRQPTWVAWASVVVIIVFVAVKAYVKRNDCEKKHALAESNEGQFRNFGDDLETTILEKPEPMADLNNLLGQVIQLKKLCVNSGIYPWNPFPVDPAFEQRCQKRSDELITKFQGNWLPPPPEPGVRTGANPPAAPANPGNG